MRQDGIAQHIEDAGVRELAANIRLHVHKVGDERKAVHVGARNEVLDVFLAQPLDVVAVSLR
jgi:hypothetical protein